MSRSYGSHSARGSFGGWNREGDSNERSRSDSGCHEHHDRPHRGQGPPPGLTGKQLGLYYRDRAKELKRNRSKAEKIEPLVIHLLPKIQRRIFGVFRNSRSYFNHFYKSSNSTMQTTEDASRFENKYTHINDSQFKRKFLEIVSGNIQENLEKVMQNAKLLRNERLDITMLEEYEANVATQQYENMIRFREKLPAYHKRAEILDIIKNNQVIVISGETGCGKTTQIAQFILDEQIQAGNGSVTKIVCTQPRRISAISVAQRVAAERVEKLGKSVGFLIRLEKVLPRDRGSILFCTTGMLLQIMERDPALREFSHIILDEIHERSTESDFIITLLKQIIPKRPDLKVILMSATLNSESFSKYYNNCPMIHIPGFTYPVEEFYLEDVLSITQFKFPEAPSIPTNFRKHSKKYKQLQHKTHEFTDVICPYVRQLIAEKKYPKYVIDQLKNPNSENLSIDLIELLIRYICNTKDRGAILVFLPGMMDIIKLHKMMLNSGSYPHSQYVIYPLHSRMPTIDQKLIFKEPPEGVRKIIIATSIAETSITIEDVVYVINCGKTKLSRFDTDKNIQSLELEWISLANAKQRRGRAGRLKPGYCYHLYSKAREMTFDEYPLPEILRTRLEEVILQIKILQLGEVKQFLASVMDAPDSKSIDLSLDLLRTLNALDNDEHLTPLGYHLAQLPLDPRTGKMIIWAALFSCIEPVFAIAASLTFKDAFYCPLDKEDEARRRKLQLNMDQHSDHIALAEALRKFELAYKQGYASDFCRTYFLSLNTLKLLSDMKNQFAQHLYQMKFLDSENPSSSSANRNSNNIALVKAIVCAGLYPNIAVVRRVTKSGVIAWTPEDGHVRVHPSSVNYKLYQQFPSPYLTYFTKQRSTAIYLHDTTCVSVPILLFASPNSCIKREKGRLLISLTISQSFICDPNTALIIQSLWKELNNLLEYKITHPGTIQWSSPEGDLLNAIIEFVSQKNEEIGIFEFIKDGDEDMM